MRRAFQPMFSLFAVPLKVATSQTIATLVARGPWACSLARVLTGPPPVLRTPTAQHETVQGKNRRRRHRRASCGARRWEGHIRTHHRRSVRTCSVMMMMRRRRRRKRKRRHSSRSRQGRPRQQHARPGALDADRAGSTCSQRGRRGVRRGAAAGRRAQGEAREQGRALPAALGERREKIHFFVVNRVVHYGKLLEILTSSSFRRGTVRLSRLLKRDPRLSNFHRS